MKIQTFTYKTLPDGTSLQADVHYLPGVLDESVPRPIALIFHGGGFTIGSRSGIPASQVQTLASYGFVVVTPDYRLCPQISVLDGPLTDALDAFIWAKESLPFFISQTLDEKIQNPLILDPKRTVAVGSSAGGTIALWLGSQPNPPNAIADFYGAKYLSDPFFSLPLKAVADTPPTAQSLQQQVYTGPQVISSTSRLDFSNPRFAWLYGSMKDGTWLREILQSHDINKVDPTCGFRNSFPPTVFVNGDLDSHVPIRFAERAWEELMKLGVECKFVKAHGQGHHFDFKLGIESERFGSDVLPAMEFLRDHCL